jgi:hypothetical protein
MEFHKYAPTPCCSCQWTSFCCQLALSMIVIGTSVLNIYPLDSERKTSSTNCTPQHISITAEQKYLVCNSLCGESVYVIVHISRVDPRNECESCSNVRFRERKKCSLLCNVKTFSPQRKKWTRPNNASKLPVHILKKKRDLTSYPHMFSETTTVKIPKRGQSV